MWGDQTPQKLNLKNEIHDTMSNHKVDDERQFIYPITLLLKPKKINELNLFDDKHENYFFL